MKYIYITMVQLPTIINKYVTFITKFEYTHFSIAFDEDLERLYSFQVKNDKIPFVGGLVEETQGFYFHGKENIYLKEMVFKVPVSESEYTKIYSFVENVKNDKEYTFNYVSALVMFIIGGVKAYKSYHCVEFICVLLSFIKGIEIPKESYKMHPKDLYEVLRPFENLKRDICSEDFETEDNIFLKRIKLSSGVRKSLYSIRESICRTVLYRTTKKFNYRMINYYEEDVKKIYNSFEM